jgi:Tfp pilus assembly protein PilF
MRAKVIDAFSRGDLAAAEALAEDFIAAGGEGEGLYLLALVRAAQGRLPAALDLLSRAAAWLPGRADIAYNHGVILRDAGHLAAAAARWRRATVLDPQHHGAWSNLALARSDLGDAAGALDTYRRLLGQWPDDRDALYNFANLCHRNRLFDAASALHTGLLAGHPNFAAGWVNLGMTEKSLGRFAPAERCYRRALALEPQSAQAHYNLANLLLVQGRWRDGFAEYEWRLKLPGAPQCACPLPVWTGDEPPGTRVVLWNDQGSGDAIQFLRYVPRLAARGYRVRLHLNDPLARLGASVPGVETACGLSAAPPDADCQLPLLSLPHRLGCLVPAGSWQKPYVAAGPTPLLPAKPKGRRIGLVWAGNPAHRNDAVRSARLDDLIPLLSVDDAQWFSLQVGRPADLPQSSAWRERITDLAPLLGDFAATASLVGQLDLVITVDTAAAHLAGAMGKPVWILLPAIDGDWRWGTSGERTAWYPSATLFRQSVAGQWAEVAERIVRRLTRPA